MSRFRNALMGQMNKRTRGLSSIPIGAQVAYKMVGEEATAGRFNGIDKDYFLLMIDDEFVSIYQLVSLKVIG